MTLMIIDTPPPQKQLDKTWDFIEFGSEELMVDTNEICGMCGESIRDHHYACKISTERRRMERMRLCESNKPTIELAEE